ncbi:oligopeptide/dipeptide ABC transporter ATP-binding protein [Natrarchaeobaculum aegyptiacum]|uniref:ABC transporter domain-containing protein n=1 Tax=Natrarchaeobaculum aegyptiacum TaxID=745377 RepID=A0A2Z2HSR2_9EURY|nr:oligopeptide/dipeptide ABC transporter ATP-binding protein [Natrarchaeobaculum aegyptiacum]ARS90199.1 hypothetical protein B1756_11005 [Natrarchaeobaculum aegyptiacum]
MTEKTVLEVEGLKKYYGMGSSFLGKLLGRQEHLRAVDDVDLAVEEGEVLGIIGESGSGKSTLVETILRLEDPTEGSIRFGDDEVTAYSGGDLREMRQRAQIIFQDPYETLNPKQTVFQAISEPLRNFHDLPYEELEEIVAETLHDVGLRPPEQYIHSYPEQLSGGERQRVSIARAVVLEPELLIADEPLSMLDVSLQSGIIRMLNRLQERIGFSMLYVSHNLAVVRLVADRIAVMYRGKIVEQGPAEDVIADPQHPYTRALVSSIPTLSGDRERVLLPPPEDDADVAGCQFAPRCPDATDHCREAVPALEHVDGRDVACYLHHDAEEGKNEANEQIPNAPAVGAE